MADALSTFYYRAIGAQGEVATGQIAAPSEAAAAGALVRAGLRPLRVQASPIKEGLLHREINLPWSRRIGLGEARSFSRDMAIMLSSGLEVHRAVDLVASAHAERSALSAFARAIHQGLGRGHSVAESFRTSGYKLPEDFLAVVDAAEASGGLSQAFEMLDLSYGQRLDLRQKLIGAAAYPIFLVLVAFAALAIIAIFVAPSLAGLFASLDRPLPVIMQVLVNAPLVLQNNGPVLAVSLIVLIALMVALARVPQIREAIRATIFRMPMVGPLFVWAATSRFASMLHLAVLNNVPIAEAAASAWATSGFPFARSVSLALAESIRRGRRLSDATDMLTYLPPAAVRLLAAGDAANRLPQVLLTIVQEAQRQVANRATMLTNLLAPALIVLVGSLVGTLVFSVFSALLEISQLTY